MDIMHDPQPPPARKSSSSKGGESTGSLLRAAVRYLSARGQLFQIEGREAASAAGGIAGAGVKGLLALLVGWLMILPGGISLLSEWIPLRWEFVTLALGALHVLVGLLCLVIARSRSRRLKLFEESLNQFHQDREWLSRYQSKP